MLKAVAIFALVASLLSGCESDIGQVKRRYDKFDDTTTELAQIAPVLSVMRIQQGHSAPTYGFIYETPMSQVVYWNRMDIKADGERFSLPGDSDPGNVFVSSYGVLWHERGLFPVAESQLHAIAKATTVESRIYGEKTNSTAIVWDEQRTKAFQKFYRECVLRQPPSDEKQGRN